MPDTARLAGVKVFISYAHKDETLRKALSKHLASLQLEGVISEWHDREIMPGQEWAGVIDEKLNDADVILLLISSDFLGSKYCYEIELQTAMQRHERGDAVVIPIILRPCDWEHASFAKLQALPKDGKSVTDWPNRDKAFLNVAQGIRRVVEALASREYLPHKPAVQLADRSHVQNQFEAVLGSESSARILLLDGESGIGKTTLLDALARRCSRSLPCARIDFWDRATDVADAFAAIVKPLRPSNLRHFSAKVREFAAETQRKRGAVTVEEIRDALKVVDEREYFETQDELTRALFEDLQTLEGPYLIFVDSFDSQGSDRVSRIVLEWVTDLFNNGLTQTPQVRMVIAGRGVKTLEKQRDTLCAYVPLGPLPEADWVAYARPRYPYVHQAHIEACCQATAGHPLMTDLLLYLANRSSNRGSSHFEAVLAEVQGLQERSYPNRYELLDHQLAAIVKAVLRSVPDIKMAAEAAAVPHWFSQTVLEKLIPGLSASKAKKHISLLQGLPFVERLTTGTNYAIKSQVRRVLLGNVRKDGERFGDYSVRADNCFRTLAEAHPRPSYEIECVYHLLKCNQVHARQEMQRLARRWYSFDNWQPTALHALWMMWSEHLEEVRASLEDGDAPVEVQGTDVRRQKASPFWVQGLDRPELRRWHSLPRARPTTLFPPEEPGWIDPSNPTLKALEILDLIENPFPDEGEERDRWLLQRPDLVEIDLGAPDRSLIRHGPLGMGKTAAALHTAYNALSRQRLFPVYFSMRCEHGQQSRPLHEWLVRVAWALGNTLLDYLAFVPSEFPLDQPEATEAICRLALREGGSGEALERDLSHRGLRRGRHAKAIFDCVRNCPRHKSRLSHIPTSDLLQCMQLARPTSFTKLLVLLDGESTRNVVSDDEARIGREVGNLIAELDTAGILVHAFLPSSWLPHLPGEVSKRGIEATEIVWSPADQVLDRMLKNRLLSCGGRSVADWFDAMPPQWDVDGKLVTAATGNPGKLMRIASELLKEVGNRNGKFLVGDPDEQEAERTSRTTIVDDSNEFEKRWFTQAGP